jgi:YHS domain-containing protein/thiol-disulfide isomerase/thioredoxin
MKFGQNTFTFVAVLVLLVMFQSAGSAAELKWGSDLKKAATESQKTGKPILITFTASWCHYCHKLLDETFTDQKVIARVNEYFVPVVLDADENERAVQLLGIEAFPSTVVISPELNVLGRIRGFHPALQMAQQLAPFCKKKQPELQQAVVKKTPEKSVAQPVAARMPAPETAFSGMCLVSMLDDRDLVRGSAKITEDYRGVKLHFASEKHQLAFRAEPAKYWPLADGHCPVASVRSEKETLGAASTAAVYRGNIVLFRSLKHRATFAEDPRHFAESLARLRSASR